MRLAHLVLLVFAVLFGASAARAGDWEDCMATGTPDALIAACTKVIEAGKEPVDTLFLAHKRRAFLKGVQQDWDGAIADYTAMIALRPNGADTYVDRAGMHNITGNISQAIADLTAAIRLNPRYADAYQRRAVLYSVRVRDYTRAIADLDHVVALEPGNLDAFVMRGVNFQRLGQHAKAISDLDHVISLKPDDSYAFLRRGESQAALGAFDKGLDDIRKAIALDPSNKQATDALATVEKQANAATTKPAQSGQADAQPAADATTDLATCVGRDPAVFERPSTDATPFIDACTRVLAADPSNAFAYAHRGFLRMQLRPGDFSGAKDDLDQAIKVDPSLAEVYILRALSSGAVLTKENAQLHAADAFNDIKKAISLKSNLGLSYMIRARINFLLENYDDALSDAHTASGLDYSMIGIDSIDAQRELPFTIAEIERAMKAAPAKSPSLTEAATPTLDKGATPNVEAGTRVALVIGNGAYRTVAGLPNPGTDADLAAQALRTAGFADVTVAKDLDRASLVAALQDFQAKADKADWAVVYYAGHGIEVAGRNFLIPVDARLKDDRNMEDEAVPLDRVLTSVGGAAKIRIVVLDACRDNPFAAQMRASGKTRSVGRGLARVEPEGSTVVLFAAREGTTAADGDGTHSPFAEAFARRITEKGVELGLTIRRLSADVVRATDKGQEPVQYGRLPDEELYFIPPG